MATPFSNKCEILGEFWSRYRDDEDYADFIQYGDLGLPLAYFVARGLTTIDGVTDEGERFINEMWNLLSGALELDTDRVYVSIDEILSEWNEKNPE